MTISRFLRYPVAMMLLLAMVPGQCRADDLPPKHFANPDRIRYDGQCLTIEGQDLFIYSGAFHYFRVPKELWRDRFTKIKAAGFNAVETYVPWNWYEPKMPRDLNDVSQINFTDLVEWMKMAHEEFGLYTIIRPGPYICAEWQAGGFPQWLWSKQPPGYESKPWVRTDDPVYLAWVRHWMRAVWPVIAKEQLTQKPRGSKGVILVQIENEYDLFGGVPGGARVKQLEVLYDDAIDCGINVPIFTCVTSQGRASRDRALSQVFDANNYYYGWNLDLTARMTRELLARQPNAPAMVSELQGGWFSEAGKQLAEDQGNIDAAQCNAITLTSIANGATILNYYMLVGSSNFGQWGSGAMLQTYDYNAPIRETGAATEKYAVVKAIGTFLNEFGPALARAKLVDSKVSTPDVKVQITVRRDVAGQRYLFCRSEQEQTLKFDVVIDGEQPIHIEHRFPAKIITVLVLPPNTSKDSEGRWMCEPEPLPPRPEVPSSVRVPTAWTRVEPGPTHWTAIKPGQSLIQAGVYDAGDVTYRAEPKLTAEQVGIYNVLEVGNAATAARTVLRVNGTIVFGRASGQAIEFPVAGFLREGKNRFELVYQNHGVANFGDAINIQPGATHFALVEGGAGKPVTEWRVAINPNSMRDVAMGIDDSKWDKVILDEKSFAELAASKQPGAPAPTYPAIGLLNGKRGVAVYRSTFEMTAADIAKKGASIELGGIDDEAELFINAQSAGKWSDYRKPFVADISRLVRVGRNEIAVKVTNNGGDGGIIKPVQLFSRSNKLPLTCELGTNLAGVTGRWCATESTEGWTRVQLDTTQQLPPKGGLAIKPAAAETLQKWARTEFEIPAAKPGVWVPWGAIIHASGNGFVYLNGHELGRYYNEGPQRRFYLPEPWLNPGRNTLTLFLNADKGEPALLGLEIAPFTGQAENR